VNRDNQFIRAVKATSTGAGIFAPDAPVISVGLVAALWRAFHRGDLKIDMDGTHDGLTIQPLNPLWPAEDLIDAPTGK
jgi:hypothetical protein